MIKRSKEGLFVVSSDDKANAGRLGASSSVDSNVKTDILARQPDDPLESINDRETRGPASPDAILDNLGLLLRKRYFKVVSNHATC